MISGRRGGKAPNIRHPVARESGPHVRIRAGNKTQTRDGRPDAGSRAQRVNQTEIAANRRGVLCMSGAMACFILNDALVKYVSQGMPAAQLIFLRGVMATLLVLAVAHALGATPRLRDTGSRWVVLRASVDACGSLLYLGAMFHLPLANATAINLASPLFMVVFAVLFLHEKVGPARWAAIGAGFIGVLLVIQPSSDGFNAYALIALIGTLGHAVRDLLTRRVPRDVPVLLITLATTISVMLLAGVVSLFQGWRPFGWFELGLLAVASVFLAAAYHLIITAMREGEMSLIAPFRYSGLLFALMIGYVVWGDVPNLLSWCGIALLICSGVYMLHGERRRRRG